MMKNRKLTGKQKLERRKENYRGILETSERFHAGGFYCDRDGEQGCLCGNYKGILEYSPEAIVLQGKTCQISIIGKRMSIDYYTNEDMKITGCIECVRYHNG